MIHTIAVQSNRRSEFLDITSAVQGVISKEKVPAGSCIVYVPHTTAGVTINENADPDVTADIIASLERQVPHDGGYRHAEGNSAAHIKASMMGFSQTVLVKEGKLVLGTWQGIYFCEFDGPRRRQVLVKIQADR